MASKMGALEDIAAERKRQVDVEGWHAEHDDLHDSGQMARAAACYCQSATNPEGWPAGTAYAPPSLWPWDRRWWKPKSPRQDLVRAGALIVAEIERLDRIEREQAAAEASNARCGSAKPAERVARPESPSPEGLGRSGVEAARRLLSAGPGENLSRVDISKVCRALLALSPAPGGG